MGVESKPIEGEAYVQNQDQSFRNPTLSSCQASDPTGARRLKNSGWHPSEVEQAESLKSLGLAAEAADVEDVEGAE